MTRLLLFFALVLWGTQLEAQFKNVERSGVPATNLEKPSDIISPSPARGLKGISISDIGTLNSQRISSPIRVLQYDENKMPIFIKGWLTDHEPVIERQAQAYLAKVAEYYKVDNPEAEWVITSIDKDEIGMHHVRVAQQYEGVPIHAGEIILHAVDGKIKTVAGRGFPTPELASTTPGISAQEAVRKAGDALQKQDHYVEIPADQRALYKMEQVTAELVIYHEDYDASAERLAYHVKAYENLGSFETYFMDAHTGEVIHSHSNICKFHGDHTLPPDGPKTAVATDLNGVNRTIDTYESGGNFFLINATKPNFSASQSSFPNDGVGVIITLDAQNKSPQQEGFSFFHVANSDNSSWTDRSSVSAHYNANIAYDYFKDVHARNAIDGGGGNVISIVNVTDEDDEDMDNAYWNGLGMFYGNGNVEFSPLAGSLDVAGHEMSHGVVQSSANLEYQNESGALNESFADVFGVMMDRDDYKVGEDVVSSGFPSGALRDLANPNNGGNQLGDPGWQPDHTSDQYMGSLDNGGVHINSGIPNHAFYLFAEQVGKDKAERVYYRALTQYLTKSSRFVDARNAVVQSAEDLYGSAEVTAAMNAFNVVGIGAGSGGDYTNDAMTNEGAQFVIYADDDQSKLAIVNASLESILDPASVSAPISVPSVSDDGSLIFYVNAINQIAFTTINWDTQEVNVGLFSEQEIWSNAVISKDGNRVAAVESAQSNRVQVYDFSKQEWYKDAFGNFGFELFNPTFTEGVSTGDAKFADALEFDISGEVLMYDAYSEVTGDFGNQIGYWDIGFMEVWSNSSADWGDGRISKLFSNLAEGLSVGNPTFSKNSPYIVAFDFIEGSEYSIIGANVETGDLGLIYENSSLGYPSYTGTDGQLVFTNETTFNSDVFVADLADSKISSTGNPGEIISDAKWGVVFRNGTRVLSGVDVVELQDREVLIFPNPAVDRVSIDLELEPSQSGEYALYVLSVDGKLMESRTVLLHAGANKQQLDVSELPGGFYTIQLSSKTKRYIGTFTKTKN